MACEPVPKSDSQYIKIVAQAFGASFQTLSPGERESAHAPFSAILEPIKAVLQKPAHHQPCAGRRGDGRRGAQRWHPAARAAGEARAGAPRLGARHLNSRVRSMTSGNLPVRGSTSTMRIPRGGAFGDNGWVQHATAAYSPQSSLAFYRKRIDAAVDALEPALLVQLVQRRRHVRLLRIVERERVQHGVPIVPLSRMVL